MICSRLPLWAAILSSAVNALQFDVVTPRGPSRVLLNNTSPTTSLRDVSMASTLLTSSLSSTSEPPSNSPISTSSTFTTSQSSLPITSSTTSYSSGLQVPPTIDPSWPSSTTQKSSSDGGSTPYPSSTLPTSTIAQASGSESGAGLSRLANGPVIQASYSEGRSGLATAITTSDLTATLTSTGKQEYGSGANLTSHALTSTLVYPAVGIVKTTIPPLHTAASSSKISLSTSLTLSAHHNTSTNLQGTTTHRPKVTSSPRAAHANSTIQSHKTHLTSPLGCTPVLPDQTLTVWQIEPNTNTVTITIFGNQSNTYTTTPEFTPPVYCTRKTSSNREWSTSAVANSILPFQSHSVSHSESIVGQPFPASTQVNPVSATTTYITTSKNPVTMFTTNSAPVFPGGGKSQKQSVQLQTTPTSTVVWSTQPPPPPANILASTIPANGAGPSINVGGGFQILPTPVTIGGLPVVVGPSAIVIGTQTLTAGPSPSLATVTEGGQTFTVNPSQVVGPGTVLSIPTQTGGVFVESPTPTVIDGVSVQIGNGIAVVAGTTFNVRPGAPEESIVANDQAISIGPGGVGFSQTTITPPAMLATNVVIFDGQVYSAVGASVAVFDGSSITYTQGSNPQTAVFNGDTITLGPSGVVDGTTTLGGPSHPTGTQLGIAGGLSVSEIGSTIAVIDGTTLTVGPGAPSTTAVIQGRTIIAGPTGLDISGQTTLTFPFNPATQEVTAGGITFSEIGASLVDIGGTTFTVGPGATPTTDVVDGQPISIGPGGLGFLTTTIVPFTSTPTTTSPSPSLSSGTAGKKKNNGSGAKSPAFGGARFLSMCIAVGVGFVL